VHGVFEKIDKEKILSACLDRLEEKIAEIIVTKLAAELSNDIKSIMSDKIKRDKIREVVNEKLWDLIETK
jgi:uncharacterized membrane protein YheB (UPF0754 family)